MNENIAIKVENLSKLYSIGKEKDGSLRGSLKNIFKKNNSNSTDFWALKDVSFEINKGDVVGIIGKNGAGKSTLLKILSKITQPTEGRIEINGRVASLLEVGTGFHPELTGRENIFLNGTILGMTRKEVASKFDEIVEFSGIEKFIDTPVKHYSSGMYVRLAFAVAAHLEPEILIIDEVLAVGDAEFQKKCLGKMKDVAGEGRTVIFVSHNIGAIGLLCSKCIVLEKGQKIFLGPTIQSIEKYQESTNLHLKKPSVFASSKFILIEKISIFGDNKQLNDNAFLAIGTRIELKLELRILAPITDLAIAFDLMSSKAEFISHISNEDDACLIKFPEIGSLQVISILFEPLLMIQGEYYFNLWIGNSHIETIVESNSIFTFHLEQGTITKRSRSLPAHTKIFIPTSWKVQAN